MAVYRFVVHGSPPRVPRLVVRVERGELCADFVIVEPILGFEWSDCQLSTRLGNGELTRASLRAALARADSSGFPSPSPSLRSSSSWTDSDLTEEGRARLLGLVVVEVGAARLEEDAMAFREVVDMVWYLSSGKGKVSYVWKEKKGEKERNEKGSLQNGVYKEVSRWKVVVVQYEGYNNRRAMEGGKNKGGRFHRRGKVPSRGLCTPHSVSG